MKATVCVEKEKIEIQDIPRPEIRSGEVLLKVEYCGICGSDVHAYKSGQLFSPGTVMGHEFSGTVAEIGDGVEKEKAGVPAWVFMVIGLIIVLAIAGFIFMG